MKFETGSGFRGRNSISGSFLTRAGLLLVLASTYFLYAPTTKFGFVYDDLFQIVQNDQIDSWSSFPGYFTHQVWAQIPGAAANLYRPLFSIWLLLNDKLFRHETAGWHLTTVLLHVIVTGLSYLLARKLLKNEVAALSCAALFGFHPIHVEAVAWVSAATEPLCAVFFLAAFVSYLKSKESSTAQRLWLASSLACYAAAMLTKETAAVLPMVVVAYEYCIPAEERGHRNLLGRVLPYFLVLLAYLLARWPVLHGIGHRASDLPFASALLTWPWLVWFYLRMLLVPAGMSPLYDIDYVTSPVQLRFLLPLAGLTIAMAAIAWSVRKQGSRFILFVASWLALTLAPALAAFLVAPRFEGLSDRYLYLPSLAICLLFGFMVKAIVDKVPGMRVAWVVAALLPLLVFGALARYQMQFWATNYSLFQRATRVAPGNQTARLNFATELIKHQQYREALRQTQAVLTENPQSVRALAAGGEACSLQHDYACAENYFRQATELAPQRAELLQLLAVTYTKLNRYPEAASTLRKAISASPAMPGLHYTLGLVLVHENNWAGAREQLQSELALQPLDAAAKTALRQVEAEPGSGRSGTRTRPRLTPAASRP